MHWLRSVCGQGQGGVAVPVCPTDDEDDEMGRYGETPITPPSPTLVKHAF